MIRFNFYSVKYNALADSKNVPTVNSRGGGGGAGRALLASVLCALLFYGSRLPSTF